MLPSGSVPFQINHHDERPFNSDTTLEHTHYTQVSCWKDERDLDRVSHSHIAVDESSGDWVL